MSASTSGKWLKLAERVQPLLLLLAGLIYWGLYLRYWFNTHDEGGTAALTAMRMMNGERPIADVALGYNVMWFYPVVWLFKITGVHYVKMRVYFFALSAVTALAGWALVRRVTGRSWLAFAVGLLLVVFPGSQFKNYIPLLGMLNTLCLVVAFGRENLTRPQLRRDCLIGGSILALTYLIRIDLALFFTFLWIGMLTIQLFDSRQGFREKTLRWCLGLALLLTTTFLWQVPVYCVARAHGFEQGFVEQYKNCGQMIFGGAASRFQSAFLGNKPPAIASDAALPAPLPEGAKPAAMGTQNPGKKTILPRSGLSDFQPSVNMDKSVLVVLTYLPLIGFGLFLGFALIGVGSEFWAGKFTTHSPAALLGLVAAGSLTTFPQFFFFRPDRPHLSEFMVGFIALLGCGTYLLYDASRRRAGIGKVAGCLVVALCLVHLGIYGWFALDHPSAGTIAARYKRKSFFNGENGVQVYASKKEGVFLRNITDAIQRCAKPGEFVVCYPYQPGYNLMTNRPTYERDIYIDNATHPPGWQKKAIAAFAQRQPAVVVIDDRAINGTENSRFSNWAPLVHQFLKTNYHLHGTFGLSEVYSRNPIPPAEPDMPTSGPSLPNQ